MLCLIFLSHFVWGYRNPNFVHKIEKYRAAYDKNIRKYKKEKRHSDTTLIINWWTGNYPLLEKYPEECGGCWLTHEKHLEVKRVNPDINRSCISCHERLS